MSMPNMPATPNTSALRRRTLARGAMLVFKPLVKLINVPGVQEFVHNAQELIVALKPWVLQAPGMNDTSAEGIVSQIVEITTIIGSAVERLSATDLAAAAACLEKLRPFTEYLERIKSEIDRYQQLPYTTKLALHSNVASSLARHDSELRFRAILLCIDKSLLTDYTLAQAQRAIMQLQVQVTAIGSNSANWQATAGDVTALKTEVAKLRIYLDRWSGCVDIFGSDCFFFF